MILFLFRLLGAIIGNCLGLLFHHLSILFAYTLWSLTHTVCIAARAVFSFTRVSPARTQPPIRAHGSSLNEFRGRRWPTRIFLTFKYGGVVIEIYCFEKSSKEVNITKDSFLSSKLRDIKGIKILIGKARGGQFDFPCFAEKIEDV